MKIKEGIERNCCHPSYDLVKIAHKLKQCQHCGSFWALKRNLGEMEAGWEKISEEKAQNILNKRAGL